MGVLGCLHVQLLSIIMACQSSPSVDDLVRHCGLSDEELNKEVTRDRFHEIA